MRKCKELTQNILLFSFYKLFAVNTIFCFVIFFRFVLFFTFIVKEVKRVKSSGKLTFNNVTIWCGFKLQDHLRDCKITFLILNNDMSNVQSYSVQGHVRPAKVS